MDAAQFEQKILEMAFETDVRLTTASVAYYLGVPSRKAQSQLDELLEQGVLELDSDEDGNLYYRVADAAGTDTERVAELKGERRRGLDGAARRDDDAGRGGDRPDGPASESDGLPGGGQAVASVDDDGDVDPVAPKATAAPSTSNERPPIRGGQADEDTAAPSDDSRDVKVPGARSRSSRDRPRREADSKSDYLAGVTRERAATDARVDSCGDRSVVVGPDARCEPRPLAESHPTLASCVEESTRRQQTAMVKSDDSQSTPQVGWGRGQESAQRALATSGASSAAVYGNGEQLERPEHQPGMSLLLSLILCGTGQIYNGEVSKGIMMMVLCFLLWFVLLGWVVHIWSIVDSVVVAERINRQSSN